MNFCAIIIYILKKIFPKGNKFKALVMDTSQPGDVTS